MRDYSIFLRILLLCTRIPKAVINFIKIHIKYKVTQFSTENSLSKNKCCYIKMMCIILIKIEIAFVPL